MPALWGNGEQQALEHAWADGTTVLDGQSSNSSPDISVTCAGNSAPAARGRQGDLGCARRYQSRVIDPNGTDQTPQPLPHPSPSSCSPRRLTASFCVLPPASPYRFYPHSSSLKDTQGHCSLFPPHSVPPPTSSLPLGHHYSLLPFFVNTRTRFPHDRPRGGVPRALSCSCHGKADRRDRSVSARDTSLALLFVNSCTVSECGRRGTYPVPRRRTPGGLQTAAAGSTDQPVTEWDAEWHRAGTTGAQQEKRCEPVGTTPSAERLPPPAAPPRHIFPVSPAAVRRPTVGFLETQQVRSGSLVSSEAVSLTRRTSGFPDAHGRLRPLWLDPAHVSYARLPTGCFHSC